MTLFILLDSAILTALTAIFAIVFIFLFMYGINWFMEKFLGIRTVGRFQVANAYQEEDTLKEKLSQEDPELVEEAIQRCKRKNYSLTVRNIYDEFYKIREEKLGEKKESGNVIETIKSKISSLILDNSTNVITKLEKLSKLRQDGAITEDEFSTMKADILKTKSISKEEKEDIEQGQFFVNSELRKLYHVENIQKAAVMYKSFALIRLESSMKGESIVKDKTLDNYRNFYMHEFLKVDSNNVSNILSDSQQFFLESKWDNLVEENSDLPSLIASDNKKSMVMTMGLACDFTSENRRNIASYEFMNYVYDYLKLVL